MYDRILVPTDGSDGATRAAREAMRFASAYDATVHVLSVVDTTRYRSSALPDDLVRRHEDQLTERGKRAVHAIENVAARTEQPVVGRVWKGVPHRAILEYTDENDIDLIAMGTHGRTGLDRLLLGSVTERVVRLADVPVFTVREGHGGEAGTAADDVEIDLPSEPYNALLVPTDGSASAEAATGHAVNIARYHGAMIHVLYVIDRRFLELGSVDGVVTERTLDRFEKRGQGIVDAVVQRAEAAGVGVRTHVGRGLPYRAIRAAADEYGVDLIAIGTHGRTGLDRLLLGSVAERTVRTADVPVLTVHATEDEEPTAATTDDAT